jgi:hypothetical protein
VKPEIEALLGGYSAGTLSADEQRKLFEAAADDQEVFDALAAEQPLRELLSQPAFRRELLGAEPEGSAWGLDDKAGALVGRCRRDRCCRCRRTLAPSRSPTPSTWPDALSDAPRNYSNHPTERHGGPGGAP